MIKLVVGLGNIGKEYDNTYHNVGFFTVDKLSDEYGLDFNKNECKAKTCHVRLKNTKLIIAKPKTYMNLSGLSVAALKQKYKIENSDIYVLCDDIDLPLGKVRLRHSGSGGTHNGLKNIVQNIGENFNRIKIGIGRDSSFENLADFVLSKIPKQKQEVLDVSVNEALNILLKEIGEQWIY